MGAVSQANGIDKTQLSKGHRKRPKKRTWKIEPLSIMIHGMAEGAQLNVNGTPQGEPLWLHDLRDILSVTRMQICSLKVPTATSWSNGSCNGPAAQFKTMWIQYGGFGKLEVSHDRREPVRNPDEKKLEFCGDRNSETCYKPKGKRNSIALQLLGENPNVATKKDVSVSKELNVVQRLSLKHKSIPFGFTENIEHKGKNFSRRNVGNFLYLLMMMMDDSTISHECQIDCLSMKRLENQFWLIYFPRSQSFNFDEEMCSRAILGKLAEDIFDLEIYSLDVEVIMEVE